MNKLISILLVGIVISSSFGAIGYAYWDSTNKRTMLESNYKQLESKYTQLLSDYATLNSNYTSLVNQDKTLNRTILTLNQTYFNLSANHTNLNLEYLNLNMSYVALSNNYTNLNRDYAKLETKYNSLNQSYYELSSNYETLNQSYSVLQSQYSILNTLYSQLEANYKALNTTRNTLYQKYEALEKLVNQPLDYVLTPTWDEVKGWLALDKTDEIPYDSDKFLCGDFSIMLIQHAKAMHWRMLFTVIEFDYYSENPSGIERHHGYHAHAFVSINTTEDIVYIEPQTDFTWYLYNEGDPNKTHIEFVDWEFIDFETEWFGHIFVQYYNRMGIYIDPNQNIAQQIKVATSP